MNDVSSNGKYFEHMKISCIIAVHVYDLFTCMNFSPVCCVGFIDIDEVIDAFRDLGVSLDRCEALRLIKR